MLDSYRDGNHNSFILEEPEYNGSPDVFPRQVVPDNISDYDLDEDAREKLL